MTRQLIGPTLLPFLLIAACSSREDPASQNKEARPGPAVWVPPVSNRLTAKETSEDEATALNETRQAFTAGGKPDDVVDGKLGLTRMHDAARKGHAKVLEFLISKGGDVNIRIDREPEASSRPTPLHWATSAQVVDMLVDHGADPNDRAGTAWPPLHWAAMEGYREAAVRLLERGAKINARDSSPFLGGTALHEACLGFGMIDEGVGPVQFERRLGLIKKLVEMGADLELRDNSGSTALIHAAKHNADCVRLLLNLGADPTVRDQDGKSALDWSRECRVEKATSMLESAVKKGK